MGTDDPFGPLNPPLLVLDIPVHRTQQLPIVTTLFRVGGDSPLAMPRNTKELGEALYRGLPSSLTAPVVVRSKVRTYKIHFDVILNS